MIHKTTITLKSGNTIEVSSVSAGDNPFVRHDEACLFAHRPDGSALWQNADLPADLHAFGSHDALVGAVTANPARFIPAHEDWF